MERSNQSVRDSKYQLILEIKHETEICLQKGAGCYEME